MHTVLTIQKSGKVVLQFPLGRAGRQLETILKISDLTSAKRLKERLVWRKV